MKFTSSLIVAAIWLVSQTVFASVNIFIQPQNQNVPVGTNASFTASTTLSGGETITSYTWLTSTNSSGPFSSISGATGPVLTITNAQISHSGFYFVRVNYQSGGNPGVAVSTAVTLTVRDQARITEQPVSLTRAVGGSASFTTAAAGEPAPGLQWRFKGTNLIDSGHVTGAHTTNLVISSLSTNDAGNYDVVATNSFSTATSQPADLTILEPPTVTVQPSNVTALVGATVALNATAGGTAPFGFRWKKGGVNLSNGGRVSGVTTDTLTLTSVLTNDTGLYNVLVTNSVGTNSVNISVTILAPPIFTSATNVAGKQGAAFSYKLTASGSVPITFGSDPLPSGLTLNSTNGQISGVPVVTGIFPVTFSASNAASNTTKSVTVTITSGAPGIISSLAAQAQQGYIFSYTIFASNNPTSFSASPLPGGLTFDPNTGVISGIPTVIGVFPITIGVTNQFGEDNKELTLAITTSAPVITSALNKNGRQGQLFTYTIVASNYPVLFSASGVPSSLNFDPITGVISGLALESGLFPITIGATNEFGSDSQIFLLNLATSAPVIQSALTANGVENQPFTYTIQASNSPISFNATDLPLGLIVNTNTGEITGTPAVGGTNLVPIFARNAWGANSNLLQIQIASAPISNLFITDVTAKYSAPYLLDFTFSLRDSLDPLTGRAIVRSPGELKVVCMEGNTNTSTRTIVGNETATIVTRGLTSNAKQLKTFLVMDYTYSMLTAQAIDPMESAVEHLINQEPASAQFAVNEFHSDFTEPSLVVSNFTSDKIKLIGDIHGIRTNFVQENYAGSRIYDALEQAITQFGPANQDEQRYLIVLSDGHDDASALSATKTNQSIPEYLVTLATNAGVQLYCVGFGSNHETNVLLTLATGTGGRYFAAADAGEIQTQFTLLLKDLNSQYFLRWATLQRGPAFQPMFEVTLEGKTDSYNTNFPSLIDDPSVNPQTVPPTQKPIKIDTTVSPPTTNELSVFAPDFDPSAWIGDVKVGALNLVPDAETNLSWITLRAFYVPRYVREMRLHYRANYPCVPQLSHSGDDLLNGWSLTQTNDGVGGTWLTVQSPNPNNLSSSIPYGVRGDLITFQFASHAVPEAKDAFSLLEIDNTIYTNRLPTGQSFLFNTNGFITVLEEIPPFGTPIPWLIANGFSNNFAAAELSDPNGNGLLVWQEYLAGLNPNDPNSTLAVRVLAAAPESPNQITFSTVVGKKYRVEAAVTLGSWLNLIDEIPGTGGDITVWDDRNLSGTSTMYYRVAVY